MMIRWQIQFRNNLLNFLLWGLIISTLQSPAFAQSDWSSQAFSSQDLSLGATQVGMVSAGGDVTLAGTSVLGNVLVGREVHAQNCHVQGRLSAGRDIDLNHCDFVSSVQAGRNLKLIDSKVVHQAMAGLNLFLIDSNVEGNAMAGLNAVVQDSHIGNTLSVSTQHLVLTGSTVKNIHLFQSQNNMIGNGFSVNHSTVIIGPHNVYSNAGIVVGGGTNHSLVSVGPGSISSVNGYTVKGGGNNTTVITPDNVIYVNGIKVSGQGPKRYSNYQTQHPDAPSIGGNGWQNQNDTETQTAFSQEPDQIVELEKNSTVTGNIVFENGHGKVLVHNGSIFSGTVAGGTVEKI